MSQKDKYIVDAAAGGSLQDLTPIRAKTLLQTMAENGHNSCSSGKSSHISSLNSVSLEKHLSNISNFMQNLSISVQNQTTTPSPALGVCGFVAKQIISPINAR